MTETPIKSCNQEKGFDFCFWAKLIVAIPLIPIIALSVASMFETETAQSIAAVIAVIAVVILARWIDRIPSLQKKIRSK